MPPFAAPAALCRLSRQRFSQVLQQSIKHLMCTSPAIELAEQPGAPRRGHPDALHCDLGGAALEVELEEGFRAAAVDDLDPGVGGGGLVLDDFDDGVGFAALALEVQPVAVAFALTDGRSEEHTSELQSHSDLVCRLLLEKKK